jgi:hypothetical protein
MRIGEFSQPTCASDHAMPKLHAHRAKVEFSQPTCSFVGSDEISISLDVIDTLDLNVGTLTPGLYSFRSVPKRTLMHADTSTPLKAPEWIEDDVVFFES